MLPRRRKLPIGRPRATAAERCRVHFDGRLSVPVLRTEARLLVDVGLVLALMRRCGFEIPGELNLRLCRRSGLASRRGGDDENRKNPGEQRPSHRLYLTRMNKIDTYDPNRPCGQFNAPCGQNEHASTTPRSHEFRETDMKTHV